MSALSTLGYPGRPHLGAEARPAQGYDPDGNLSGKACRWRADGPCRRTSLSYASGHRNTAHRALACVDDQPLGDQVCSSSSRSPLCSCTQMTDYRMDTWYFDIWAVTERTSYKVNAHIWYLTGGIPRCRIFTYRSDNGGAALPSQVFYSIWLMILFTCLSLSFPQLQLVYHRLYL